MSEQLTLQTVEIYQIVSAKGFFIFFIIIREIKLQTMFFFFFVMWKVKIFSSIYMWHPFLLSLEVLKGYVFC